jgi:hypothetical protein
MLVSPFSRSLDTNKYTNKFAGYQQTLAHQGEGYMLQFAFNCQGFTNDGE